MTWIACRVTTGKEYDIRKRILRVVPDAQIMIPRRKVNFFINGVVRSRTERILPGYVLIGSEESPDIIALKEFIKVLGRVTHDEIEHLRAMEAHETEDLEVGIKIIVVDGPLQGCKGVIVKTNEDGTMYCKMMFQGMEIPVNMNAELLSSIGG
jgi:transcription antitermination factor NusG